MRGLMMDFPLTLDVIVRRAEQFYPNVELVARRPDRSIHRSSYGELARRARHLAAGLESLGLAQGDRVATLAWNNIQHCEAYFGVPSGGYVCHTLNLRLHPDELAWIATDAGDRAIIVDDVLLPLLAKFRDRTPIEQVIVINSGGGALPPGAIDFEAVVALGAARDYEFPRLDENTAASMCYTSGTTGKPKGVVYSHRSQVLHCFGECLANSVGMGESDCGLAIVPLFHANAWGFPYAGAMMGMRQVFPGPHLDAASLLELIEKEKVTLVAGVPTIMMGVLAALDANPGKYDISAWRMALIGGSAVPQHLIKAMRERHDVTVQQGWGMTETSPLASVARPPAGFKPATPEDEDVYRARQGRPIPFVEIRARNDDGVLVAWDGEAMGELEVRGPWVVGAYYHAADGGERFTSDGWFRTGDLVSIHADGCIQIRDRTKDVIKSGGEWVSSVALENAIMGHPAVAEAAVIGVPEPKWMERPIAVVVCKPGKTVTHEEIVAFLEPQFPKWWMPDATEIVDAIPKSGAGKFQKTVLRERFGQRLMGRILLIALLLLPQLALAQSDSGTVRVAYDLLQGATVKESFNESKVAGFFPLVYQGRPAVRGRKVATPLRLQGCARNAARGTYNVEFNASFGPEGMPTSGKPGAALSLQVGGYPWDRSARYTGAATYPQHWALGPRHIAKVWQFRPAGKRMWDQIVRTDPGSASITVNANEISGSFVIGPYSDRKGQAWTVRGTFECSRLMKAGRG